MKYILILLLISRPLFAHDLTTNIPKEEHKLMHVLEKYLIDDSSRVRKFTYKKIVEIFSLNSLAHFIELLEKKEHPELRYVAKLLKKQFFKDKASQIMIVDPSRLNLQPVPKVIF